MNTELGRAAVNQDWQRWILEMGLVDDNQVRYFQAFYELITCDALVT